MPTPSHHGFDGRFRNPWPEALQDDALRSRFRRVALEWLTTSLPPDPEPGALPVAEPDVARPTASEEELRVTWVGHATHLVQLPGLNLVTDPMWSKRASPVRWMGASRFVPPGLELEELPPLHGVLLSHDHYDHLDRPTVVALRRRFGPDLPWYVPLGYREWFQDVGVGHVVELDWWEEHELPGTEYRLVAAPARHWTRRSAWGTNRRLWCSWAVLPSGGAARDGRGFRFYFGGDSGYASVFEEIGRRLGPFDVSIVPIGAYEPSWFMHASHMNPEEAVQAWEDLGGTGIFLPSHWGTFRLTFEDPLEPPGRLAAEWSRRGHAADRLRLTRHGETVTLRP